MKVKVNPELCCGTGLCENTCPEVFELKKGISTIKVDNIPAEAQYRCKQAAQGCPTKAISVEFREIALFSRETGGVL
jgi:ferredoxin